MSGGWTTTKWGTLATLEYGRALRGYESRNAPYRVFGTNGPIGWHLEAQTQGPGVIVGRKGAYRGIHYSPKPFWVIDTAFYLKPKVFDSFDMRWAYYNLRTVDLDRLDSGAAIPSTSRDMFYEIPVQVPPLDEQRRIASILSTYDNLIEANQRRVAILEEMARRLFEEWFIHLRFPGHAATPLHDTLDGPVPEGWTMGAVGDLLTLHRGYDLATTARQPGSIPVMTGSGRNGTHNTAKVAGPGVVTGRSGTVGQVFLVHEDFWPLNTALYVSAYRGATPSFALFLLRTLKLQAHAGGAAVPTLNRNHVHALPTLQPPSDLIQQFDKFVMPMLESARAFAKQNDTLAAARDLLLPRLLSGQLSVAQGQVPALMAAE